MHIQICHVYILYIVYLCTIKLANKSREAYVNKINCKKDR